MYESSASRNTVPFTKRMKNLNSHYRKLSSRQPTFLAFLAAKFWMTAVKSSSRRVISHSSILMTVGWTSLLWVMDVRTLVSVTFNLEKERFPVQLEINKTRYIAMLFPHLEKYRPPLFSLLTAFKNISKLHALPWCSSWNQTKFSLYLRYLPYLV